MQAPVIGKDIIQSLSAGEEWAFHIIFEEYSPRVYGLAIKMGLSREDAEGVLQEVFCAIWKQREAIRDDLSINSFILTIAKRQIIKVIRSKVIKEKHLDNFKHLMPASHQQTEDEVIYRDLFDMMQKHLEELPAKQKEIFTLSKRHGLTNDAIALKLNLSKRTVENQLYRAIQKLKSYINTTK